MRQDNFWKCSGRLIKVVDHWIVSTNSCIAKNNVNKGFLQNLMYILFEWDWLYSYCNNFTCWRFSSYSLFLLTWFSSVVFATHFFFDRNCVGLFVITAFWSFVVIGAHDALLVFVFKTKSEKYILGYVSMLPPTLIQKF